MMLSFINDLTRGRIYKGALGQGVCSTWKIPGLEMPRKDEMMNKRPGKACNFVQPRKEKKKTLTI